MGHRGDEDLSVEEIADDICARFESVRWYHEFHFPNGLVAQPDQQLAGHRRVWAFERDQLDRLEFRDKSVLDIGCWDGMWSIYAESRGASYVLATDDFSQNWATSAGLELVKEMFDSSIEICADISVYDIAKLERTFDVILCLGVYYHLVDPFYAFSQIRHLCHEDTVVVFEGDVSSGLHRNQLYYRPGDSARPAFVPRSASLTSMLEAAYFEVLSHASMVRYPILRPRTYARFARDLFKRKNRGLSPFLNRTVTICRPRFGTNEVHPYPPPFGLERYDDRWPSTST